MITEATKRLVERVVNVFESGSPVGSYACLVVYADGVGGTRQITYGRSQTTEQSNLRKLVEMYMHRCGRFSSDFIPYLPRIGIEPLVDDAEFKNLLVRAAQEDPVMASTQDEFFDTVYYQPAYDFFTINGFHLPLSLLVIYDSFIHSGSVPKWLRERFAAVPPAGGGDERSWVIEYVTARHNWLSTHERRILRGTIYRTQCFKDQFANDNWRLDKLPIMANGTPVFL